VSVRAGTRVRLERLLDPRTHNYSLESDARSGLTATPKWLLPKYFYDDYGSDLFEEITRLPEYYPTRAERALLEAHGQDIIARAAATSLVELGSGSSEKSTLLLHPLMKAAGNDATYVPVEVSAGALEPAIDRLSRRYPKLGIHGVMADVDLHLADLPAYGRRLVAFLGGTLGNYQPAERRAFLAALAGSLAPGDAALIGVDLVKDPQRLVLAYDDAAGVTAQFNLNILRVLNRELDADFDLSDFAHVAVWDAENRWIQMRLRALRSHSVLLRALDLKVTFEEGEEIRTEISTKFRRDDIEEDLTLAGLCPDGWWTDSDYALVLARRRS